jgi:hypothetical protein
VQGVWARTIDPGPVIDAYGQAMRPGIENRGAKFWAAFQCLTRLDTHKLRELAEGK